MKKSLLTLILLAQFALSSCSNTQTYKSPFDTSQEVAETENNGDVKFDGKQVDTTLDEENPEVNTSDWSTHKSEKYNISFAYPRECVVIEPNTTGEDRYMINCHAREQFIKNTIPEKFNYYGSLFVTVKSGARKEVLQESRVKDCKDLGADEVNVLVKQINNRDLVIGGCPVVGNPSMVAVYLNEDTRVEFTGDIWFEARGMTQEKINSGSGVSINANIYTSLAEL